MDLKKITSTGLLAGVAILVLSFGVSFAFEIFIPGFSEWMTGQPGLRSMDDPMMLLFFLHPFVLGIAMAFVYSKVNTALTGKNFLRKGAFFGLLVWIVATLPSQFVILGSMEYPLEIITSWAIAPLIEFPVAGILIAKMMEEKEELKQE